MADAMLYQSGTANDGNTTIPLYDWDGVTLLCSVIVSKTASPTEAWTAIHAATAELMGPVARGAYQAGTYDPDTYYYDPDYPLTAKQSYSFGKWLDVGDDTWTNYGLAIRITDSYTTEELPTPEGADATTVPWSGLKAAYKGVASELTECGLYGLSVSCIMRRGVTSSAYDITLHLERGSVHRLRNAAIRVQYTLMDGNIYRRLLKISDSDTIDIHLHECAGLQKWGYSVIDFATEDWVGGSADRSQSLTLESDGEAGIIWRGTLAWVNKQLRLNVAQSLNSNISRDIGITLVAGEVYGTTTEDGGAIVRRVAMANILTAWKEKNGITGDKWPANGDYADLTQPEMVVAVATGHYAE